MARSLCVAMMIFALMSIVEGFTCSYYMDSACTDPSGDTMENWTKVSDVANCWMNAGSYYQTGCLSGNDTGIVWDQKATTNCAASSGNKERWTTSAVDNFPMLNGECVAIPSEWGFKGKFWKLDTQATISDFPQCYDSYTSYYYSDANCTTLSSDQAQTYMATGMSNCWYVQTTSGLHQGFWQVGCLSSNDTGIITDRLMTSKCQAPADGSMPVRYTVTKQDTAHVNAGHCVKIPSEWGYSGKYWKWDSAIAAGDFPTCSAGSGTASSDVPAVRLAVPLLVAVWAFAV